MMCSLFSCLHVFAPFRLSVVDLPPGSDGRSSELEREVQTGGSGGNGDCFTNSVLSVSSGSDFMFVVGKNGGKKTGVMWSLFSCLHVFAPFRLSVVDLPPGSDGRSSELEREVQTGGSGGNGDCFTNSVLSVSSGSDFMFVVGKKMEPKNMGDVELIFLSPCFLPPSGCPLLICRLVQVGEVASWKGKLKQEEAEVTETDLSTLLSPLAPVQISVHCCQKMEAKTWVMWSLFSCLHVSCPLPAVRC